MQETICAKINPRLLTKADRLFTGTVEGRIIEMLQNARRAGATEVRITQEKGFITVADNGSGIEDFQILLDLGGSGWEERIESGEDPAGVGLFSLAPREVTVVSGNRQIVIAKDGWTGKPIHVTKSLHEVKGTRLTFQDDTPWAFGVVDKYAVFTGLTVIVDGQLCHTMPFCGKNAAYHADPGCRIEVTDEITPQHKAWALNLFYGGVLVNFHGQVVQLDYWPGKELRRLIILVDIADRTGIRLMLPARTCLVENQAFKQLKAAIEREYYTYFQKQQLHHLGYESYLRARELGIDLPEAEPQFKAGLIQGQANEAVEVDVPKDFQLKDGTLCTHQELLDSPEKTNAHLLGALGSFKDKPFVPVTIDPAYRGYSWAKLPQVVKVKVTKGKKLLGHSIRCGELVCYDQLAITVHTSDGKVFRSDVAMAITATRRKAKYVWHEDTVGVTEAARNCLSAENVWFHFGGYDEEGDSYDTQLFYFEKELDEFWNDLIGPYETLRQQFIHELYSLKGPWRQVTVFAEDESLEILYQDGRKERITPPAESA